MARGATVICEVTRDVSGMLMHVMEQHSDVFIVDRREHPSPLSREIWQLRSDRFPSEWEGEYVVIWIDCETGHVRFERTATKELL